MTAIEAAAPASPTEVRAAPLPVLPHDEIALATTVLVETEAAERARIRSIEALVFGLAAGCLYFLLVSPISRPLTLGDLAVVGSLAAASLAFFLFYRAEARAHADVADRAQHLARQIKARLVLQRPPDGDR